MVSTTPLPQAIPEKKRELDVQTYSRPLIYNDFPLDNVYIPNLILISII